jgi:hypothetical protein
VTLYVWVWYPNPDGLFADTNRDRLHVRLAGW